MVGKLLTAGLDAGRKAGGHADQVDLPVVEVIARLALPSPEEGAVDLEAPEAGSVEPDVAEGDAGEVEAGAEGEERSVEHSEQSVAAGQGVLQEKDNNLSDCVTRI